MDKFFELQQDILQILLKLREKHYVMTADISNMYRQVLVSEDDTKYQRLFCGMILEKKFRFLNWKQ